MNRQLTLIKMYVLLVYADDIIDDKELVVGKRMAEYERITEDSLEREVETLRTIDHALLYKEVLQGMKQLDINIQVRFVAWLSIIANADGFMDEREWQLIYRLYSKDLHLPLADIMLKQKELKQYIKVSQKAA
ncbi:hypothetical protein JMN32_04585 [Fulvivirga sp. 29W222]|uniref:Co-chaperone DjlA N-terminal domain-containing protein n=1 Tax=Fulvivirga marina TaxID=2494733 RepID=A0A937FVY6_9BACT|nr:hypothetical protein [Fulvivirga marina]MBL6445572.1 hypothetical protein [Fulvivirga marina]